MVYDVIVIGAGQAGLAAGYYLQESGLTFVILEAHDTPGGSWPFYYDSLRLNSPARFSALPGLPFPGQPDRYPRRDDVVAYLRAYATAFGLPVITNTAVASIERVGELFRLQTTGNNLYFARSIVAATGFFGRPFIPALPGSDQYRGTIMHIAQYRRPEPFRGQRIVIVGGANGAVQVGVELARVARVTLATRSPIRYLPQHLLGRDIHFWLRVTGLDWTQWLNDRSAPVFTSSHEHVALAIGSPDRQPLFAHFTPNGITWANGSQEAIDTVLFATGYLPNLPYLAGLGAFDAAGRVLQRHGISTTVPGLGYVGLARQRSVASATLRGAGPDARIVVEHLKRYCTAQAPRRPMPPLDKTTHQVYSLRNII